MIPIGEFSKICEVSTKALRYYEEIELIKPIYVHPKTGYRYFSIDQLKTMLFINRLKQYHFSLDEIKNLIDTNNEALDEQIETALKHKGLEIKRQILVLQSIMRKIESDISSIEHGLSIMNYLDNIGVQLIETKTINILSIRKKLTKNDCTDGYGKFFDYLYRKIAAEKLTVIGYPLSIFHSTEYNPNGYDIEFAIPVKEAVTGTRDFTGCLCIKSRLIGSYSEITSVYARQRQWAENNGYDLIKSPYDVYVTTPYDIDRIEDMKTDIYYPIKKQ